MEAPLDKGSKAGTYTVVLDGEEVEKGELLTAEDVEKGWIFSKLYISNKLNYCRRCNDSILTPPDIAEQNA